MSIGLQQKTVLEMYRHVVFLKYNMSDQAG